MLARLSSIPHAISESISKLFNCRRKTNNQDDEDPNHKPFKLQSVPSLVFERVLHQMNPIEVFELSNCSEKIRPLIQMARLASHCDVEWCALSSEISITMKSGRKFRWCFGRDADIYFHWQRKYLDYSKYEKVGSIMIGKKVEMQIYKNGNTDTIYSIVNPSADVSDYFFERILSIFECPIKTLTIILYYIPDNRRFRKLFKNKSIKKCENLSVYCSKPDDFESSLRDFEVTKRVTISYLYRHPRFRETEIELANLVNLSELSLECVDLRRELLFTLNNEHLVLEEGSTTQLDVKEFLMRWMDGEFKRLKTLRCLFATTRNYKLESFLDGLKMEQHDPSDTRPCLVKFSDNIYIDCTTNMGPGHHRAMCIRNQEGQNGTIVMTGETLHFVVWTHPVPPVEVPNGHILGRVPTFPLLIITPRTPQIFENETEAWEEGEGLLPDRLYWKYWSR